MTLAAIQSAAKAHALDIFGAFHTANDDHAPEGTKTLILLGPLEPGFWAHFTAQPEYRDGQPDPIDRWSTRVINQLAHDLTATALFPFGGPPYQPFISWAMRSGRCWQSPAGPLVHDTAGMMVSYRGALAFKEKLDLPDTPPNPCDTCTDKPCLTTCPVNALGPAGYDTDACHAYLDTPSGLDCMANGCAARRACPVSQTYGRLAEQSAFHMRSFHPCPSY